MWQKWKKRVECVASSESWPSKSQQWGHMAVCTYMCCCEKREHNAQYDVCPKAELSSDQGRAQPLHKVIQIRLSVYASNTHFSCDPLLGNDGYLSDPTDSEGKDDDEGGSGGGWDEDDDGDESTLPPPWERTPPPTVQKRVRFITCVSNIVRSVSAFLENPNKIPAFHQLTTNKFSS